MRLALIGFGNVGQAFARLLLSKREWLREALELDVEVAAVATLTRGSLMSDGALDLGRVLSEIGGRGSLTGYGPESTGLSALEIIEGCGADLMVELTTLNIESGRPAIDHIRAALGSGMSVITANKGPLAFAYRELRALARSRRACFRFEGTVMDGAPVFSLVERTLPGCRVTGIAGILNSTSNFILSRMARGAGLDEALREARMLGMTEADPSLDVDGWDAAAKTAALANVLMDAGTTPQEVDRAGIGGLDPGAVRLAARRGMKFKLVARAERAGGSVETAVRPERMGPDDPFWSVEGASSAVTLRTDLMGEVTIVERDPGLAQTAYAVFSDMILIHESIRAGFAAANTLWRP
ncbi:hypothetical protein AC482_04115 [miscellaneous Crenarchaeota group-15 archaeon DG-45]|uniref:Homoserine dehydrogenase n=1 Tax=miscellaneous Crenarchaeota group-15 archaeon DG-45 TaxID=1685127 RepID=A0A0M0BPF3_9ARCH|nr:MAG: hypothetical protein AC482_04115 [miscellaneous Crenarchaeota group-15 archaeon DG-45]